MGTQPVAGGEGKGRISLAGTRRRARTVTLRQLRARSQSCAADLRELCALNWLQGKDELAYARSHVPQGSTSGMNGVAQLEDSKGPARPV